MPIFALEHGLTSTERGDLETEIRASIRRAPPLTEHRLPWIVYASEIGYRYTGLEYWPTFAEQTPGWLIHGDRTWIRDSFRFFHQKYGGARPTGRFAEHFTIICWPISHAILPLDLQRQLVGLLYDVRHAFSEDILASPFDLGRLVASKSLTTNNRFQLIAEEPLLIGQIAASLLLKERAGFQSLILPSTLDRIANDLERESQSRLWLGGARQAADRVRFGGFVTHREEPVPIRGTPAASRKEVAALCLEPKLILRPVAPQEWEVLLEIPDFTLLSKRFASIDTVLRNSRCVVAGYPRPLARGRVLSSSDRVPLKEWPSPGRVLLQFEPSVEELDYLLGTECLLREGPTWLFKIAADGFAYEVRGLTVRAGQKYILASTANLTHTTGWVTGTAVRCSGLNAVQLNLPAVVSPDLARLLQSYGLRFARTIKAWPVGLPSANWDREGRMEWLNSDVPCIAVRLDHAVDRVTASLDAGSRVLDITPTTIDTPVFFSVPSLSLGTHNLRITWREGQSEESGEIQIVIRQARPWSPNTTGRGAFRVVVDPVVPTLEELWEGRATIQVSGPQSWPVDCVVSLFVDKGAVAPLASQSTPPLHLPVDSTSWLDHFERHIGLSRSMQNVYELVHFCQVTLDAGELGRHQVSCEREFRPLRWLVQRDKKGYRLKLIDDTGSGEPVVWRRELMAPNKECAVDHKAYIVGFAHAAEGLYAAAQTETNCAIIIPPTAVNGLEGLQIKPAVVVPEKTDRATVAIDLANCIEDWASARAVGGAISQVWQREVISALTQRLFGILGGPGWEHAEASFHQRSGHDAFRVLRDAVSTDGWQRPLAEQLGNEIDYLAGMPVRNRVRRFASKVSRWVEKTGWAATKEGSSIDWLCEFALRLASQPDELLAWAEGNTGSGAQFLADNPVLARAARFVVLTISARSPSSNSRLLHQGWEWR